MKVGTLKPIIAGSMLLGLAAPTFAADTTNFAERPGCGMYTSCGRVGGTADNIQILSVGGKRAVASTTTAHFSNQTSADFMPFPFVILDNVIRGFGAAAD